MRSAPHVLVRRPLLILAAVSTVVALGGTAAVAGPTTELRIEQSRTDELINLVDANPASFAGVSFDESTGVATVRYPTGNGLRGAYDRLAKLNSLRPGDAVGTAGRWRVSLTPVTHSNTELEAVRQRVASDAAWQRLAGPWLSQWYVDVRRNVVAVGLTEITPAVREAANRMFGGLVELHVAPVAPATVSRQDDFEPWHAGNRINLSSGTFCTSGFVMENSSNPNQKVMITAGHCGNLNDTVTNNGHSMGSLVVRVLQNNGLDVADIGGSTYFPFTYTGPPTSGTGFLTKGTRLPAVGLGFCSDGSVTGENCSGRVDKVNICQLFSDGITRCALAHMVSTNGTTLVQGGDSGGPVIRYDGGVLNISGIIIGGFPTETYYHPFNVLLPSGWRVALA